MQEPIELEIIKGVEPVPGDTETAEKPLDRLNLLSSSGLALDTDGWQMAYPSLKNQGLWIDSPTMNGRELSRSPQTNVIETMTLTMTNNDLSQRQGIMKHLFRLQQDARDFWSMESQYQPVYLNFKPAVGVCNQYALLYTFDVAMDSDPYDCTNSWLVTLTFERAPWRAVVPPGGNPRLFKFWKQNWAWGINYTIDDLRLHQDDGTGFDDTTYSAYDTVDNRFEWEGGGTSHEGYLSKNWIDIPADEIPGDMEADAYISVTPSSGSAYPFVKFWVARYTRPTTFRGRQSDEDSLAYNILAAGDGVAAFGGGAGTAVVDACGVYCRTDAANQYIVQYTAPVAAGVWQNVLQWYPANQLQNIASWRGTWAAFLRCQQTNGAQDDVQARLVIEQGYALGYGGRYYTDPQVLPYWVALSSCREFPVMYLGQFTLPLDNEYLSGGYGRGAEISGVANDAVWLSVETLNTKTATRTLEFLDLILMPVDEAFGCFTAENSILGHVSSNSFNIMDTTGYAMHGKPGMYASVNGGNETPDRFMPIEYRGAAIRLKPGVNNRLYFLFQHYNAAAPVDNISYASAEHTIRVSVVPRFQGIADVEQDS